MDVSTSEFILEHVKRRQSEEPVIVGLQGPQGSGKSTLSENLYNRLAASPHCLRVAFLSLDDLYRPHAELEQLKLDFPHNKLLHGRGQPGTHDVRLGTDMLRQLRHINDNKQPVHLPVYGKSLNEGQGDRLTQSRPVQGPLDCIIFEGWCTGFQAVDQNLLESCYSSKTLPNPSADIQHSPLGKDYLRGPFFLQHPLESVSQINQHLRDYESLWQFIDCFIQIVPQDMSLTWEWRLQQEHNMKAKNGGKGMSDQAVEDFVARYMPGYECFGGGIEQRWKGALLRIVIDKDRTISQESRL